MLLHVLLRHVIQVNPRGRDCRNRQIPTVVPVAGLEKLFEFLCFHMVPMRLNPPLAVAQVWRDGHVFREKLRPRAIILVASIYDKAVCAMWVELPVVREKGHRVGRWESYSEADVACFAQKEGERKLGAQHADP